MLCLLVYLDIYADGTVKGLKGWRGDKGPEPNWGESETNKRQSFIEMYG